jgi:inner membrane protein YhjD
VNTLERLVKVIDRGQQRHRPTAFAFGVVKKFGDDAAGSLAALIAYYGFLSIFPLLLVLTTVLGLFFAHDQALQDRIVHSAVGQFPIVGTQLSGPDGVRSLHAGGVIGLVAGLIALLWGAQGVSQAAQRAMAEVWNVPGVVRPGYFPRLGRSFAFIGLLGVDVIATTALAGAVTIGHGALWFRLVGAVISLLVNMLLYVVGFRILTPKSVETRHLVPGALVGGFGWTALQYAGTALVGHTLRHANETYGYFGSVLGLISFLFLAAELAVYAAEINVVRARGLYPRSLAPPPLTAADEAVLRANVVEQSRRPEMRVEVDFSPPEAAPSS